MRYNVAQLLRGQAGASRHYDLNDDIGSLDPTLEIVGPLVGSITLMRSSQGVLATGRFQTKLSTICRRCLEPCVLDVDFELEEEFYPIERIGEAPMDVVPEEDRDEALRIDSQHILDLSEVIRQNLWLAAPEDALCRPDCAGLCPRCGGNRNLGECDCSQAPIDLRWAALQMLLTDESDS
jgi:uncharacterized protein